MPGSREASPRVVSPSSSEVAGIPRSRGSPQYHYRSHRSSRHRERGSPYTKDRSYSGPRRANGLSSKSVSFILPWHNANRKGSSYPLPLSLQNAEAPSPHGNAQHHTQQSIRPAPTKKARVKPLEQWGAFSNFPPRLASWCAACELIRNDLPVLVCLMLLRSVGADWTWCEAPESLPPIRESYCA